MPIILPGYLVVSESHLMVLANISYKKIFFGSKLILVHNIQALNESLFAEVWRFYFNSQQIIEKIEVLHFIKPEKFLSEINSSISHPAVPVFDKLIQYSLFIFVAFSMFSISVTQIAFSIGASCWLWKVHLTQTWKEINGTLVGIAILCFC